METFEILPPVRMISPVGSTASSPTTWCRVTPYLTARIPPAFVPTLPPTLALSSPGWTVYPSPASAVRASRSASVTPGWTTATWFAVSTSSTAFIRSNEITRPFSRGRAAPESPVPEPRAVTGTPCSPAALSSPATSSALPGFAR